MKKIFIIEQEEKISKVYRNALTEEGFEVFESDSMWNAVMEIFNADDIDLVVWGINTHQEESEDYLMRIARDHGLKFKLIVSSVYSVNQQKYLVPVADDYFEKMQGVNVLIQKVRNVLLCPEH